MMNMEHNNSDPTQTVPGSPEAVLTDSLQKRKDNVPVNEHVTEVGKASDSVCDFSPLKEQLEKAGIATGPLEPVYPEVEYYRLNGTNSLAYQDESKRWCLCATSNLQSVLSNSGVKIPTDSDARSAFMDVYYKRLLHSKTIDVCVPVAGCKQGLLCKPDGEKILVSRDSGFVEPVAGDSSRITEFLQAVLGSAWLVLASWMKLALQDLRQCREHGPYKANIRPHQAMVIVGPAGCGKSLLKKLIVDSFGGTSADPGPFLMGETRFNDDLSGAVTLVLDDSTESMHPRSRNRLTQGLKRIQVVGEYRVEAKGQRPTMGKYCQRILILSNEDAVESLPMMQESYRDKVHILQARQSDLVCGWPDEEAKNRWVASLFPEIPAFVHWLLEEHQIRQEQFCPRYGMKAVHAENLLSVMEGDDVVNLTDGLIRYAISSASPPSILDCPGNTRERRYERILPASELFALINQNCNQHVVSKVLRNVHALGNALSTLIFRKVGVYCKGKYTHGNRKWEVTFDLDYDQYIALSELYALNKCPDRELQEARQEIARNRQPQE